ncbi:MAG: hypothetical protein AAF711_20285 [Planctomycetota bacterium]
MTDEPTPTRDRLGKILEAGWLIGMGLFLGLSAGLVMALASTFHTAQRLEASPGVQPYADERFAQYHDRIVAGLNAQQMFGVIGVAALVLLGIATVALILRYLTSRHASAYVGSRLTSRVRAVALTLCLLAMFVASVMSYGLNQDWYGLYDLNASDTVLIERRSSFDARHGVADKIGGLAWLSGLAAFAVTPWCRKPAEPASNP